MTQAATLSPIPFIDLGAQRRRLGTSVDEAILKVVNHGAYVMGPEVFALEQALAEFCGSKEAVTCASGDDALLITLMAKGVKSGDAVLCPAFTFVSTGSVVVRLGATPVFVDVHPDTFNVDAASVVLGIRKARELGLRPVGFIPVDLFGQPADYDALEPVCAEEGLWILSDAAQSFGATYKTRKVGMMGMATTTSFFPAKPLGCYGDGGAIFTDDAELAALLRSIRIHGQNVEDKYDNQRVGMTGRMDTIQAAVLLEKLKIFPDEVDARNRVAARYDAALSDIVDVPLVLAGCVSSWAQYTVKLRGADRAEFANRLKAQGVPTAIYYPKPLNQQGAYRHYPVAGNGLPVSDRLAGEVISLPMHPYLDETLQDRIIASVRAALS
ncbi:DegT/DnrJ/EryC1/StrS family aminotransferase [Phreatobacter stygius]|uniref:DegT/DnrJ/EryC1/StrS aminotransferase family protein n=1 Tax=Phreatobacter stygius TaxID=1940610 RepID=A0A4D7AUA3_9HYPH|nr:DegT/DnrJ/EryC1/StrS aminotransferase family protein [Phreatobacter stygius]QCI63191.1 DegT/DnrJ/EryC1/StrS aminotransferase family protein [Phreatobacter stygius]